MATTGAARDGTAAADSPFRRRWTWRTRIWVVVAGWAVALALRLLYRTLRVRVVDHGDWFARRRHGEAVLAVFWHEGIVLLPLLVTRERWPGTVTVMLSWHRDAEIAAQAVSRLGIRVVRGSDTRGGSAPSAGSSRHESAARTSSSRPTAHADRVTRRRTARCSSRARPVCRSSRSAPPPIPSDACGVGTGCSCHVLSRASRS